MMISSFVNNLSGCSLSRGSTLSLVIWYPWSSDCHFSPFSIPACLCTLLFYMEQTVILQMFMQTKRFLVSHFEDLRETYCKAFQRQKSLFYKKRFYFTPLLASAIFHIQLWNGYQYYSLCHVQYIFRERRKAHTYLHFLCS